MAFWKNEGRIAGFWYLSVIGFGIGAEIIRSSLSRPGDAAAQVASLVAHADLYRLGLVGDLVMMVSFVFLVLAFHRWLERVDRPLSLLMLMFVGISVAINMTNLANHYGALLWATDPGLARDFGPAVGVQSLLAEFTYRQTYQFANVFFGLWLIPLGILLLRSKQVPGWLGVLVSVAGAAFLVDILTRFLFPAAPEWLSTVWAVPSSLGEFGLCLWLLARGSRA